MNFLSKKDRSEFYKNNKGIFSVTLFILYTGIFVNLPFEDLKTNGILFAVILFISMVLLFMDICMRIEKWFQTSTSISDL